MVFKPVHETRAPPEARGIKFVMPFDGMRSFFRKEIKASSWAAMGMLYCGIFVTMTIGGTAAMAYFGPNEGAKERRENNTKPYVRRQIGEGKFSLGWIFADLA